MAVLACGSVFVFMAQWLKFCGNVACPLTRRYSYGIGLSVFISKVQMIKIQTNRVSLAVSWIGVLASLIAIFSYIVQKNEQDQDLALAEETQYQLEVRQSLNAQLIDIVEVLRDQINNTQEQNFVLTKLLHQNIALTEELGERLNQVMLNDVVETTESTALKEEISKQVGDALSRNDNFVGLNRRMETIESVIVATPEKAMKLPLIQKVLEVKSEELDEVQVELSNIDKTLEQIKQYENKISVIDSKLTTSNTWMSGILIALLVSIVGMLLSNITKNKENP
ncbi:hypothetical protein [Vibrio coralliilyticus]|uniref:hypothetical protein n=1 Tax=Vibrio coralliilyticus TaxID=190893 RepID=UPI001E50EB5F|nr:hypothetical protein [Vibrio coralliilyticus]MCC2525737.1 hypothetical protein [Vibrio coralliilyticus]